MNYEGIDANDSGDGSERVFRMWEPLRFTVKKGYDYRRNGLHSRIATALLHGFAVAVLSVYDRLAFGYKIEGRENLELLGGRGAVTVCNHVHQMDCTMIDLAMRGRRMYYLTIEENFKIPVIRHIVRILGGVPIARGGRMAELFDAMGGALCDGNCVQIYPEGVMDPYCKGLRRFKDGAFHLAVTNGAPILPMVVTYRRPRGFYALYKKKPCLHITILPPVECPAHGSKRERIQQMKGDATDAMSSAIERLSETDMPD